MTRNRKPAWRTVAAVLAAALIFTLMPASAFAVSTEPSGGLPADESAQGKYADRMKEYAAQIRSGGSPGEKPDAGGADGISDAKRSAIRAILGNESGKAAIREILGDESVKASVKASIRKMIAGLSDRSGSFASASGTGYGSRSFISPGALTVDAAVTKLPFVDTRTLDKDTHKITLDFSAFFGGGDEYDGNTVFDVGGYAYRMTLKKGAYYSMNLSPAFTETFYPLPLIVDKNGDTSDEMLDGLFGIDDPGDDYIFRARKSGTHYLLVLDGLELILAIIGDEIGGEISADIENSGGKYTLTLDRAYSLSGTVKDSKGKPVKNAQVEILKANTKYVNDVYLSTRTDSKGRYIFPGIASGKYKMRFYKQSDYKARPKYRLEYYTGRYSVKTAKLVNMPSGKNKKGVNVRLSAYKSPKADMKVKSLSFKTGSRLYSKPREILTVDGYVLPARVYSVKLMKGNTYDLTLDGKKIGYPVADVIDSKGYYVAGVGPEKEDGNIAKGSFTPQKTDVYRIEVYNYTDSEDHTGALESSRGKFSLSVSKAFIPGRISGKVTRAGGYPCDGIWVMVYKKYGKKWVSYMYDCTDMDGSYNVIGLRSGEYKVKFSDGELDQEYDDEYGGESVRTKYFKKGKTAGVAKKTDGSKVKVYAGRATRNIDVRF